MFQPRTLLDANDYPVYRRRNDGRTISKNGVIIDNRHIVPYNLKLLKKYQARVNIEWCNQSTSIKYLFKYINKGYTESLLLCFMMAMMKSRMLPTRKMRLKNI